MNSALFEKTSEAKKSEMNPMRSYDRAKVAIGGLVLSDGLRAKVMRGGAWLGTGSVAEQWIWSEKTDTTWLLMMHGGGENIELSLLNKK